MSQRIAANCVKDRPILVLVGGPAGRPIGGVSVFVTDRDRHPSRCLIAHLNHAVRVEKREGRCFYQFPQRLRTGLNKQVGLGKMLFADVHPETDPSGNQNSHSAHLRKGDAFLFGKGVVLVHGKIDLLIHVALAVKRFVFRKGMQDDNVIPSVLQSRKQMLVRIDQLRQDRFLGKIFLQRRHQLVDREWRARPDTDGPEAPVVCQYMVDQILIGLKGFLRIFGSHLAGLIQGELAVTELIRSGNTDRKTAAALLHLLAGGLLETADPGYNAELLSDSIRRECSINKRMADRLAIILYTLYSQENREKWRGKEKEGLTQFLNEDFSCEWKGFAVWDEGNGTVDCRYEARIIMRPTKAVSEDKELEKLLAKNPFTVVRQVR